MAFFLKKPAPPPAEIMGVAVRLSQRARRMSLGVDSRSGAVVLTLPPRAALKKAEAFVAENAAWIARQRGRMKAAPVCAPGMRLSLCGQDYTVEHLPGRGAARVEDGRIVLRGDAAHFRRRLRDAVKNHAEKILAQELRKKTARLGLEAKALRVADPRTRWGSCGADGRVMLSWRLVLAPPFVMDYVVAHETAHRLHLNHSRKFWALCETLAEDAAGARRWLRLHGRELMTAV